MDTNPSPGQLPQAPITIAEVAETIKDSIGDTYSDSANRGENAHLQQLLHSRIRRSDEDSKGLAYVMSFRGNLVTDSSVAVPCKGCTTPIPEERIVAMNFAVTHCIACKESMESNPGPKRR